jgi:hypothetical protein
MTRRQPAYMQGANSSLIGSGKIRISYEELLSEAQGR